MRQILGENPAAQVEELARCHPQLYATVDLDRLSRWVDEVRRQPPERDDFGPEGRGSQYLEAQLRNPGARATGIECLINIILGALPGTRENPIIVDLLGGDGLVQRVSASLGITGISFLTCDSAPYMVAAAWRQDVPALLQRAEKPLLKSSSVDAVLLAYGSHHIPPDLRPTVVSEVYRVLRPGGVLLLHDFLCGSATETWFSDIVDRYSSTGHQFIHFTAADISRYFMDAGFEYHDIKEIADPYVATGLDADEARFNMGDYLIRMYGLVKAESTFGVRESRFWAAQKAARIFESAPAQPPNGQSPHYDAVRSRWTFTIPRRAVIGVGRKGAVGQ